jgi:hypothetical protein
LGKGAAAQEYFVYFKLVQRIPGEKFPQSAAVVIVRCCLKYTIQGSCWCGSFAVASRDDSFIGSPGEEIPRLEANV